MPTAVPESPTTLWLFAVVILALLGVVGWLVRFLFKRVLDEAAKRAEDWKEIAGLHQHRVEILERHLLPAIQPVAEAATKVLSGLPDPREGA